MSTDIQFLDNHFTVTEAVLQRLYTLLLDGKILVRDPAGLTTYRIDPDFLMGVKGFTPDEGVIKESFRDVPATKDKAPVQVTMDELVDHIQALRRDQLYDAEWYGRESRNAESRYVTFTSLADQIPEMAVWDTVNYAIEKEVV